MKKEIDGLLVAAWRITKNASGQEIRSPMPTQFYVETNHEQVSLLELLEPFYDPDNAVFVRISVQREDVDGNPI